MEKITEPAICVWSPEDQAVFDEDVCLFFDKLLEARKFDEAEMLCEKLRGQKP